MSRNAWAYVDAAGRRLISVSEVLRMAGLVDFSSIPEATLETARQRGVDVHGFIEGLVTGMLDEDMAPDPRIAPYVGAWHKFRLATGFLPSSSEVRVLNQTYGYAGTLDLLGEMGGSGWLLDIKATAAVPSEAACQTIAYRMALSDQEPTESGGKRKRGVIHLRRDGTWALVEHKNDREDQHNFLSALRVAQWRLAHGLVSLED